MKSKKARLIIIAVAVCVSMVVSALVFAAGTEQVIQITAKRFSYTPNNITVKQGTPVVLEFTSLDVLHGFDCPELGIRTDIPPHQVTKLKFTPKQVGTFSFHCDNFCGSGHDGMRGTIIVVP